MFKIRGNKQYKDMALLGVSVGYAVLQIGKPIRYEPVIGVIYDNNYLYYKPNNEITESVSKVLVSANNVLSLHVYDSFVDLIREYKQFENKKNLIRNIVNNIK